MVETATRSVTGHDPSSLYLTVVARQIRCGGGKATWDLEGDVMSFKRILVYVSERDQSLSAVDHAATLARRWKASVTLLRVVKEPALAAWSRWSQSDDWRQVVATEYRAPLEARAAALRQADLDVRVDVSVGTPWQQVIYKVLRDDHDLVVKVAEGTVTRRGPFFGSTALHLIRKCPCPVWVVGKEGTAEPSRVLAAVDPGQESARAAVARQVLRLAHAVRSIDGAVHALAVWNAPSEHLFRSRATSRPHVLRYIREMRESAQQGLADAVQGAGGPIWADRINLVKGEPAAVISQVVKRQKIDLVVMGSVGRVGIDAFLIGETADTVIRSVTCSVLVVKPEGFVSPVKLPDTADALSALRGEDWAVTSAGPVGPLAGPAVVSMARANCATGRTSLTRNVPASDTQPN